MCFFPGIFPKKQILSILQEKLEQTLSKVSCTDSPSHNIFVCASNWIIHVHRHITEHDQRCLVSTKIITTIKNQFYAILLDFYCKLCRLYHNTNFSFGSTTGSHVVKGKLWMEIIIRRNQNVPTITIAYLPGVPWISVFTGSKLIAPLLAACARPKSATYFFQKSFSSFKEMKENTISTIKGVCTFTTKCSSKRILLDFMSVAERRIAIEMEVFLHLKKFRLPYKLFNKQKFSKLICS